ncbi:MAG: recombinase family protein, partial [Pyrinomonadaceae bacterium]
LEACRLPGRMKPVKRLVVDEAVAWIIRELFTLYASGLSQEQIARSFNERGVPHPTGCAWRQPTLSYMLANPAYKGEGLWRRRYEAKNKRGGKSKYMSPPENIVRYEDYQVPAVVAPELWERCARQRAENLCLPPATARRAYLLSGLIRCGIAGCGRKFTGVSNQQRWFYYQCNSRVGRNMPNCANRRLNATRIESLVWHEIVRFALNPGNILEKLTAKLATQTTTSDAAARIQKQLRAKGRERERVITWARQGRLTEDELDRQLVALRAEAATLEGELARLEATRASRAAARAGLADAEAMLERIAQRLSNLTEAEKAESVRQLVRGVLVNPRPDGRITVKATYVFSPALYNDHCPASSVSLT